MEEGAKSKNSDSMEENGGPHGDQNLQWEAKVLGNLLQEPVKPLSPSATKGPKTTLEGRKAPPEKVRNFRHAGYVDDPVGHSRHQVSKWKPWTWFQRRPALPHDHRRNEKESFPAHATAAATRTVPSPHFSAEDAPKEADGVHIHEGVSPSSVDTHSTSFGAADEKTEKRRTGLPPVVMEPLTPTKVEALHPDVKMKREEILNAEKKIHLTLENVETGRNQYLSTTNMSRQHYCEKELERVVKCMKKANQTSLERIKAFKASQGEMLVAASETPASGVAFARNWNSVNSRDPANCFPARYSYQSISGPIFKRNGAGQASFSSSSSSTSPALEGGNVPYPTHAREESTSGASYSSTPLFSWWENAPVIALDALECNDSVKALEYCTREVLKSYTQRDRES